MLEICFAIIMGFGGAAVAVDAFGDDPRLDRILVRSAVILFFMAVITALRSDNAMGVLKMAQNLIVTSLEFQTGWVVLGAVIAILYQVWHEGHIHSLWVRFSPNSAPTREARAGQRSAVQGARPKVATGTLVGTSTPYLTNELDLKTESLVRLSFYAFENRNARTVTHIESSLRLGTGYRRKAFLKIAAETGRRGNPKRIVHRYWRSVNGSSRMGQALFGELCNLARATHNLDDATLARLKKVGLALQLTPDEMSSALSFMR
ncbi:hypothetical protein [Litorimonas sp. WD9-15]|uniref:hypothetical protein n=1 Tax=Litorimonas sp. WD9-15 TaxID=3418716 RepID=UPI003D061B11